MKIIFSRKGFDTKFGGVPSPIIDGVAYSLPIPTGDYPSKSRYGDLNLGDVLSKVNAKDDLTADSQCHEDPMFWLDRCAFGQVSSAQGVLKNGQVREGDVFLFFGLFKELTSDDRHHRIFGYLKIDEKCTIDPPTKGEVVWRRLEAQGAPRRHPHTLSKWDNDGTWQKNNTIYIGHGRKAKKAPDFLRLTKPDGPASFWCVPAWLRNIERTPRAWRWRDDGTLHVRVGQEFIVDIEDLPEPKAWLDEIVAVIETNQ
jgi:Nucleotide modification associated domain 3